MVDKNGKPISQGDRVQFFASHRGSVMPAKVVANHPVGYMLEVQIADDPFTSFVDTRQLSVIKPRKGQPVMAKSTAKELRKQAKAAGIDGWEEMDRDELAAAIEDADLDGNEDTEEEASSPRVAKAKKASGKKSVKKSPASKKAASGKKVAKATKATEDNEPEGPNPFRPGTNLWHMTEALMAGGKRSAMVKKLLKKIELNPRVKGGKEFDAAEEIDYRLVRVCQLLTNEHGFTIDKDGRGKDQQVQALPPE